MPWTRLKALIISLIAAGWFVSQSAFAVQWGPVEVAGRKIWPGETLRFPYGGETSFESAYLDAPVFVARGVKHGPALCITAGIHGDEINGTEIARRAFSWIDPKNLSGNVIVLSLINI